MLQPSCLRVVIGLLCIISSSAFAQQTSNLRGQVLGGGAPISGAAVTLWAASSDEPKKIIQVQTGDDGRFTMQVPTARGTDVSLYLVATGGRAAANPNSGDNPAIALMTALGNEPPANVVINEMTTVASVWTHAQFLDAAAIKGPALSLRIAARNVPNFVDLETGGWGTAIQDPLNSGQTPTMANFATLADVLAGCVTRMTADACSKFFAAATPPKGSAPTDTLTAAQSIARYPWYQPERLFSLLDQFYPVPQGKTMRAVPFMPYLSFPPSAWVLPLKFDGGGYRAGGGLPGPWAATIDGNDNVWVSNFAAANSPIVELCGTRTENCPPGMKTGDQISPPGGYVGGGLQMQTDLAIDPAGNVWVMNNWQDIDSCFGVPDEALSTRCGGQGVTVFYGMAKPVHAPQIGPARAP